MNEVKCKNDRKSWESFEAGSDLKFKMFTGAPHKG